MLPLSEVEKRIKFKEETKMTDKSPAKTEDILVDLISKGLLKAWIDKQKESIIFEDSGDTVSSMVKKLEEQTLKII